MTSAATGPYAFVFWNDDLTDEGVLAQLRGIAAAGFAGVTLSARIGLSRRVGYRTEEFFRLVRAAVEECARLGLAVMLYDEASYPSGSANGAVVARDHRFAARCLVHVDRDVAGPVDEYWRPALGRSLDARLLAVVRSPQGAPGDAALLPVEERGLVRLALPEGRWRVRAVFDVPSGGTIRGAHTGQDDGSALAPAAADLLNPDAVRAFLESTHEAYARALGPHLGSTVVAMFTDEPFLLGRNPRRGAVPYTPGLEAVVAAAAGLDVPEVLRRLPSLWDGDGAFARAYGDAVRERLIAVYYGAQARWCEAHGIALTGHPAEPDDLATAAGLHWPGQDTVWRWALPGATALAGPESTAPKTAASAARLRGAPAVAEVLGAYGWGLTLDEAKWLLDWYLSRGVSTLVMHALYYSVRGGRAYESEPDLGPHNSWWPHFPALVAYTARIAALYEEGAHRAPVAVLCDPEHAPDAPARDLLGHQVDFLYLDPARLQGARIGAGTLTVGDQRFAAVLDLRPDALAPDAAAESALERFAAAGGLVLGADWAVGDLKGHLRTAGCAVDAAPAAPGLRVVRLDGADATVYACFNEGEDAIATTLTLPDAPGDAQWFDPFTGTYETALGTDGVALELERRQTKCLVARTGAPAAPPRFALGTTIDLPQWTGSLVRSLGETAHPARVGPGDWAARADLIRFSGTYRFTADLELPEGVTDARLDLGEVGEAVKVTVNGTDAGDLLWRPYTLTIRGLLRPGPNRIELLVSNSAANYYEGARRPSGLLGPVTLTC